MTKQTVVEVRLTHKVEGYNKVRYFAIPSNYYSLPQNAKLIQFMPTMSIDTENTLYIEVYPLSRLRLRHGLAQIKEGKVIEVRIVLQDISLGDSRLDRWFSDLA